MPIGRAGVVRYPGRMAELGERAERWASTMHGHADGAVAFAHADSWAGTGSSSPVVDAANARRSRTTSLSTAGHPGDRRRRACHRRGARSVAHLLRTRPRPHPARQRVPAPRRQDAGVRVPRRPSAHPAHPCARGRPGRHLGRPSARAQRGADRGDRARSRLRPRPRRARQRGRAHAVRRRRLRPCGVGRRRHPDSAEPVRRDARRHPQPLVVAAGADRRPRARSSAGPTASPTCATTSRTPSTPGSSRPTCCPPIVRDRCGERRSHQLGAFITAMIQAAGQTGRIGMTADAAEALAAFRKFNYDNVYLRPASQAQARSVIALLQALVEHYADAIRSCCPTSADARCRQRRGAARRGCATSAA